MPVMFLIQAAYTRNALANARTTYTRDPVAGGPDWIRSDRYDIQAKAQGVPSAEAMQGPLLQSLLEDRFQLKVHQETVTMPIYELTVAKNGSKLRAPKEGDCTFVDFTRPDEEIAAARPNACNTFLFRRNRTAKSIAADFHGMSLDEIVRTLSRYMDRQIVNQTGITGRFDLHFEFVPDESTPAFLPGGAPLGYGGLVDNPPPVDDTVEPSISKVIEENLGLKLVPTKGPGAILVIDRVERPSAN